MVGWRGVWLAMTAWLVMAALCSADPVEAAYRPGRASVARGSESAGGWASRRAAFPAPGTGRGGAGALAAIPSRFAPITTRRVAVLVLLPAVSLAELAAARTTGIRSLLTTGAVGVMNARTGPSVAGRAQRAIDSLVKHPEEIRPTTLEAACVTLGAGTRCSARGEAGLAFEADERVDGVRAADCWVQRTGLPARSDRIYQVAIARLQAHHARFRYQAQPGALGEALRQAGMLTAVVGNADDAAAPHREAACIAMDASGRVPLGAVGRSLWVHDPNVPGGRRTDAERVLCAVEGVVRAGARLVVVETGDTARVDRAHDTILAEVRPRRRLEAIERADRIVAGLLQRLDPATTLLFVLAPAASLDAAREGNVLPPVIMAGCGVERGLLYSPSTRTPGLAVLTDIAPTVLSFLRVPVPPQMIGRPLSVRRSGDAPERVLALEAEYRRVDEYARPLARWLVWAQVGLFGVFLLLAWVHASPLAGDPRRVRFGAFVLAALPASLLLAGVLKPPTPGIGAACLLLILSALAVAAAALDRWIPAFGWLWLGGAVVAGCDTLTGSRLLQGSPVGYSPYSGARFYGIGNEGFGLLIPGVVLGVAFLHRARMAHSSGRKAVRPAGGGDRATRAGLRWAAGAALATALVIGHPALGANFGGGLSAVFTAVALAILSVPRAHRKRAAFYAIGLGLVAVALPVVFDLVRGGGEQSHVGRAVDAIRTGGAGEAWSIIIRKAQMNASLLRHSPWSRLLLATGAAFVVMWRHAGAWLRDAEPLVWRALAGLLAGAAAALAFNDSGVIPAAEMVVAATASLGYVLATRRDEAAAR